MSPGLPQMRGKRATRRSEAGLGSAVCRMGALFGEQAQMG